MDQQTVRLEVVEVQLNVQPLMVLVDQVVEERVLRLQVDLLMREQQEQLIPVVVEVEPRSPPPVAAGSVAAAEYARSRWSLECVVEAVGGARVGEAVGGGDFHGLSTSAS